MDRTKTPWGWKHAPLAAFVTLALVGGIAINESAQSDSSTIREANVRSCERVNDLREQVNKQGNVTLGFLESAANARQAAGTPLDLKTATQYRNLQQKIKRVPLDDCEKDFPKP